MDNNNNLSNRMIDNFKVNPSELKNEENFILNNNWYHWTLIPTILISFYEGFSIEFEFLTFTIGLRFNK